MTDYLLPSWWGWIEDWLRCRACLEYNHPLRASYAIPPEKFGHVCLGNGGTAAVAESLRGNRTIASAAQAQAAVHATSAIELTQQPKQQSPTINIPVEKSQMQEFERNINWNTQYKQKNIEGGP